MALVFNPFTGNFDYTGGTNGATGADGASAYEVAVAEGFVGTEAQWLASLVGADGADGADALWNFTGAYSGGASYAVGDVATYAGETWYRINANGGNVGDTPSEGTFWTLIAEKGADGADGSDATVTIGASAVDVLSVAAGEITADDAGLDKLVFWDDSAGKLTHLTLGTNLSITDTTLDASGGGNIDPIIAGMIF